MKKVLSVFLGVALAITICAIGFAAGICCTKVIPYKVDADNTLSDEEIVNKFVMEHHGSGHYAVLTCDDDNDEFIEYLLYSENGKVVHAGSLNRETYGEHYSRK